MEDVTHNPDKGAHADHLRYRQRKKDSLGFWLKLVGGSLVFHGMVLAIALPLSTRLSSSAAANGSPMSVEFVELSEPSAEPVAPNQQPIESLAPEAALSAPDPTAPDPTAPSAPLPPSSISFASEPSPLPTPEPFPTPPSPEAQPSPIVQPEPPVETAAPPSQPEPLPLPLPSAAPEPTAEPVQPSEPPPNAPAQATVPESPNPEAPPESPSPESPNPPAPEPISDAPPTNAPAPEPLTSEAPAPAPEPPAPAPEPPAPAPEPPAPEAPPSPQQAITPITAPLPDVSGSIANAPGAISTDELARANSEGAAPVGVTLSLANFTRVAPQGDAPVETLEIAQPLDSSTSFFPDPAASACEVTPEVLNRAGVSIALQVATDEQGKVLDARVYQSSGSPEYDQLAACLVKEQWQFQPATALNAEETQREAIASDELLITITINRN